MAGCGGSGKEAVNEPAPGDLSGSLPETQQAPKTPEVRSSTEPGQAPESTDFAPVDIELKNGRFAPGTPKEIHVPSDFIVIVSAEADDHGRYRLGVVSPSVAQTFFVAPGEQKKITLDSLREGQQAKLMLGKQTVQISADAEPGP